MIRGIPIEMGGREWIVPPLSLGQLRASKPDREILGRADASLDEQMEATARLVLTALNRNYPDLTLDQVENDLLDAGNFREVVAAILTGSGLRPAISGEAAAARIGAASMGSSPQPVATAPATSTS